MVNAHASLIAKTCVYACPRAFYVYAYERSWQMMLQGVHVQGKEAGSSVPHSSTMCVESYRHSTHADIQSHTHM